MPALSFETLMFTAQISETCASLIWTGAVCGTVGTIQSLMDLHLGPIMLLGPTMDPKVASELHLRIPHLGIRMAEHSRRALAYAQVLQKVNPTEFNLMFP